MRKLIRSTMVMAATRGHHPILMDFGLIGGVDPPNPDAEMPGIGSFASFEPTRYAMGDPRRYAERMQLIAMTPRGDLTSTGYALANLGKEYLIFQPLDSTDALSVQLQAGSYTAEWFSVKSRRTADGGTITLQRDGSHAVAPPFPGPAVLY